MINRPYLINMTTPSNSTIEIELESTHSGQTESETTSILASEKSTFETEQMSKSETKNPLWIGNSMAFCYRNGYPMFTIGPNC